MEKFKFFFPFFCFFFVLIALHAHQTQQKPHSELQLVDAAIQIMDGLKPEVPQDTNPRLESLMIACWDEPKLRPTFKRICAYLRGSETKI